MCNQYKKHHRRDWNKKMNFSQRSVPIIQGIFLGIAWVRIEPSVSDKIEEVLFIYWTLYNMHM